MGGWGSRVPEREPERQREPERATEIHKEIRPFCWEMLNYFCCENLDYALWADSASDPTLYSWQTVEHNSVFFGSARSSSFDEKTVYKFVVRIIMCRPIPARPDQLCPVVVSSLNRKSSAATTWSPTSHTKTLLWSALQLPVIIMTKIITIIFCWQW